MTVVGDYQGACRAQAGYSGDQIELVQFVGGGCDLPFKTPETNSARSSAK